MKNAFWLLLIAFVSFLGGRLTQTNNPQTQNQVKITRAKQNSLINPLLDCEVFQTNEPKIAPIQSEINQYLNQNMGEYQAVSVYFRDLNNGPWFGVNEKAKFAPMSLLKVPVMIAYLRLAQMNPAILDQELSYNGEHFLKENISPSSRLNENQKYTIDALISRMMSLSDNTAFEILVSHISENDIRTVHEELGLAYPQTNTPEDYISVKNYAGLFRILYNATYLSRSASEKGLNYLLQSDYEDGIKAGIPKAVKTALKFGIKDDPETPGLKQIHDCGIIYVPKKPYLLCVMTKGEDVGSLSTIIAEISRLVYEGLDK